MEVRTSTTVKEKCIICGKITSRGLVDENYHDPWGVEFPLCRECHKDIAIALVQGYL